MPYKWMLLLVVPMAATPLYLLWQGDGLGAAIVGIPSLLIGAAMFACMRLAASD